MSIFLLILVAVGLLVYQDYKTYHPEIRSLKNTINNLRMRFNDVSQSAAAYVVTSAVLTLVTSFLLYRTWWISDNFSVILLSVVLTEKICEWVTSLFQL